MITRIAAARAGLALSGLLLISGCSTLNQLTGASESIDYKSTVTGDPLVIPPDLTQANDDTHYKAPEGTATLSTFKAGQAAAQSTNAADRVLPQSANIKVMRDGSLRWLVVDEPAQTLYPKLIEFWGDQGFTIHSQDPKAGLIETDWAENRAKIPEGWLRSALGSVLDQVFDSGERDRFTMRIERDNANKTEIYVSHQHMVDTPTSDGTAFKWVFGKEDPGLNAAMLARLMVYLGENQQTAAQEIKHSTNDTGPATASDITRHQASLVMAEPFDRAWRRVGVALDSARFTVEDRNREQGDYYIRYLDTDNGQKIEQQTIFGRIFGTRNTAEPLKFRVHVAQQGGSSEVTVLDQNGKQVVNGTADRILTVLAQNLKTTQ
ncbi:MAG TPA: outer membrane protein assembly factor BamC [Castellaniella sp.]|uniref:outer membrane protein assembly factor BamC n=1 Tax=Castellaniella sp. TaxID=1955812 RepID=UPI002EF91966